MKAELIFREKQTRDDFISEMVVWHLQKPVPGCRHQFKYRFYFGTVDGTCLVRYDNERGKGDHKHIEGANSPSCSEAWKRPSRNSWRTSPR